MRKITVELKYRVPSWGYCTLDDFTDDNRFSKDRCRFCMQTKHGYRCMLYEEGLAPLDKSGALVRKCSQCVNASAGYRITAEIEGAPVAPDLVVNPKEIMRHAVERYRATVAQLIAQGYPQVLAEELAAKYMLGK